jgi:class 3 adenylate cyclase
VAGAVIRRNGPVLRYISAALFALATFGILRISPFYPSWLLLALSVGAGVLAAFSPATAALCLAVAGSAPLLAADLVAGVVIMIAALVATQYLADGRATGFLLVALVVLLLPIRGEWAVVALAGYLLGRGRGALAATMACIAIELAGLLTGAPSIGALATGGSPPGLIDPGSISPGSLTFGWLTSAAAAADPDRFIGIVRGAGDVMLLIVQPVLWGVAAAVSAAIHRPGSRVRSFAGVVGAIAVLTLGTGILQVALGAPTIGLAPTVLVSLVIALVVTAIAEWAFPLTVRAARPERAAAAPVAGHDVDDLLRVIASAEEELAAQHQTSAVVLITDMKSFASMTEELGSLESAKIVQRHRDLLLPVIGRHRGRGKSTGGDGLVAAFSSPSDAVSAAAEMQRTLREQPQAEHVGPKMLIRVGIAEGDVVLDKGGRPFLGSALNVAARVMDLADGGRIMTTGGVADGIEDPGSCRCRLHAHGDFQLKSITEPLPVVEVLWYEGQTAEEIRAT